MGYLGLSETLLTNTPELRRVRTWSPLASTTACAYLTCIATPCHGVRRGEGKSITSAPTSGLLRLPPLGMLPRTYGAATSAPPGLLPRLMVSTDDQKVPLVPTA